MVLFSFRVTCIFSEDGYSNQVSVTKILVYFQNIWIGVDSTQLKLLVILVINLFAQINIFTQAFKFPYQAHPTQHMSSTASQDNPSYMVSYWELRLGLVMQLNRSIWSNETEKDINSLSLELIATLSLSNYLLTKTKRTERRLRIPLQK